MRHHYGITPMQVFAYNWRAIAGGFVILSAAALWYYLARGDAEAIRARAQSLSIAELPREPREVRIEYLRLALAQPERADPHELTVALTLIDRQEARALYEDAIRPAIHPGAAPQTLALAFELIDRWDVTVDAGALTKAIVVDLGSEDNKRLSAAAFGIATLAGQMDASLAQEVAETLVRQMQAERPPRLSLLGRAFAAVAPRLDAVAARVMATGLVARMMEERDWYALRPFEDAVAALPEFDGTALANRLLDQAQTRSDLAGVDSLLRAARALHDTPAVRSRAASILGGRAHAGLPNETLVGLAMALPELSENAEELTRVAQLLTARIDETREPYALMLLAMGLTAAGPSVPVEAAQPMAVRIGARVLDESDSAPLARLAVALHGVSHGWSDAQARTFARQVLGEMKEPRGEGRLRLYAVALHAVADRAEDVVLEEARAIVRERSTGESREMSLLALGEQEEEVEAEAGDYDPLSLLDPTIPEGVWTRVALSVLGIELEDDDPTPQALAGVEDDDGAEDEERPDIDFNALSEKLATLR